MNFRALNRASVSIAAFAVTACAVTSEGLEIEPPEAEEGAVVLFDWQSSDSVSGNLNASLTDGRTFTGPYFVESGSGEILVSLGTASGDRMRCRFRLAQPSSGISGGGEGKCQLDDGTTIGGKLPRARESARS